MGGLESYLNNKYTIAIYTSAFNHLRNITIIKYKSYRRDKQTKLKEASDL